MYRKYDFSDVDFPDDGTNDPRDFKFVRWMTKELVSLCYDLIEEIWKKSLCPLCGRI